MDNPRKTESRPHCMSLAYQKLCWRRSWICFRAEGQGLETADRINGIAYDIPGAEYTHYGGECTFDYILKKHNLQEDPALQTLAFIVRGADTDRFDLAPEAAGLWAISAGLSYHFKNDQEQLQAGMLIYDALYSWAKYARNEKHTWQSATWKSRQHGISGTSCLYIKTTGVLFSEAWYHRLRWSPGVSKLYVQGSRTG